MARNRKRAKERRARRPEPVASAPAERDEPPTPIGHAAPDVELAEAQLAVGRPELVADPDLAAEAEFEEEQEELDHEELEPADGGGGRGRWGDRGGDGDGGDRGGEGAGAPHPAHRPRAGTRLVTFLQGSWRELQRVQWPDRRQVMQATGVVIGFVIVAGIYLGLADEVATKVVNFILK